MWYQGLAGLSALQILAVLAVFLHLTIVSVTLYLHRYSAHRSLQLNTAIKHLFRFWLWLTTGMSTKEWTAIHRKHHAQCETPQDPHSPVVVGLGKVFWQGTELYKQANTPETLEKYGKGTPDDWVEHHLYAKSALGISLMLIIDILLFGAIGITVWAIQMIWIPLTAAGVINGIGHAWGYRNFESPDAARNILPWGIIIGGEELHNNHHTYPNSPKLSVKWWEFDIGWFWIRTLKLLGLAKVRSMGPLAIRVPGKRLIDIDTTWATLNDRFNILAQYSKQVVFPLVNLEKSKTDRVGKKILNRVKVLICRDQIARIITKGKKPQADIRNLLAQHPNLERIYDMRKALQSIWQKGAQNINEMSQELQAWCLEAEASQIQALKDFADYLRSYSMPRANALH